jgi:hypothetical protein
MLHLTRVAFGADSVAALHDRIEANRAEGVVRLTTRYRPKRHEALVGGSLYWIIKHRIVARAEIVGFEEAEGGRTHIVVRARLVLVQMRARRAHQGWRYLEAEDAPPDLDDGAASTGSLPPDMRDQLSELGLV